MRTLWAALILMAALAAPAWAQDGRWWRAESANFVVYGDRGEQQVLNAARDLEDFDSALRLLTRARASEATNKLEVFLLRDTGTFREIIGSSRGIAGFYIVGPEQAAAFAAYDNVSGDRLSILFHEYAHHFMLHYFPYAYPRWYTEGWADYVSTIEIRGRRAHVGIPSTYRSAWIAEGSWLPIETLLEPEQSRRRGGIFWQQFYAQAWFASLYIANTPERRRGLDNYIRALGDGADVIASFEGAFGISPETFERELRTFRRSGSVTPFVLRLPDAEPAVQVVRLPAIADDLLLPLTQLRATFGSEEAAIPTAEHLESAAARAPDHPLSQIALARAALLRSDFQGARTRLEAIVAADESRVEARYLLATAIAGMVGKGETQDPELIREMRRHLVRNFRQDPNHFPTLRLYAESFARGAEPMTTEQLQVLARALELSPRDTRVRLMLAEELMRADAFDQAIATLRPLLYDPHHRSHARRARVLFEAARAGEDPPLASPEDENDEDDNDGEEAD